MSSFLQISVQSGYYASVYICRYPVMMIARICSVHQSDRYIKIPTAAMY
jgi:hypothetical protein